MNATLLVRACLVAAATSAALFAQPPTPPTRVKKTTSNQPGIRLDTPSLPPGQSVHALDLKKIVQEKSSQFEKMFPKTKVETLGKKESAIADPVTAQALLHKVPTGFGNFRKTKTAPDPGPKVVAGDPRVIPFANQPLIERIIGQNNLMPVRFLEAGVVWSKAVGRVAIKFEDLPEAGLGTGFMVSKSLFMTNNHVIPDKDFAKKLDLQFNYQYGLDGNLLPVVTYEFDPDGFFHTDTDLDFTLIRVKPRSALPDTPTGPAISKLAGEEFGSLRLTTSYFYSEKQLVNVVQHPQGRPKEIALHDSQVVAVHDKVIRYTADTEPGSSGSPVFNNSWRLIALHHSAGDQDPATGQWVDNEGVRIDRIIEHIKAKVPAVVQELGL